MADIDKLIETEYKDTDAFTKWQLEYLKYLYFIKQTDIKNFFSKPVYKGHDEDRVKKYFVLGIADIDFKDYVIKFLVIEDAEGALPEVVNDDDFFWYYKQTEDQAELDLMPI